MTQTTQITHNKGSLYRDSINNSHYKQADLLMTSADG